MKKHLLGLAVFSFIVVSFAVLFAFLYAPKVREINEVRQPVFETEKRNKCNYPKKLIKKSSLKITQATLTERNWQFNATIEHEELSEVTEIRLHFFVMDGKKVEYLTTKNSSAFRNYNIDQPTAYVNFQLFEMKRIFNKKGNNLYVIPEISRENLKLENPQVFVSSMATSVLWEEDSSSH